METPAVGKNVDSWCTRCKMLLAHTIEAKVGTKITRVHCNTCKSPHAFRARPPGQSTVAGRARTGRSGSASSRGGSRGSGPPDYATLLHGRDEAAARRFVVTERFNVADLLSHPTFGLGIVTASKEGNKIEVLFPDGPKVLVHAR